jgi:hypothetical protein
VNFIPIRSYDNYIDAHITMGKLKEEGVNCWLKDENSSTIAPFLTLITGGIKLMVAESQIERANEILNLRET